MGYARVYLKVPDADQDWLAVTRVSQLGEVQALGYLKSETFTRVADTLRPLHDKAAEEGHPSWEEVAAWEDFVKWVDEWKGKE